jgi:hypothetical protein
MLWPFQLVSVVTVLLSNKLSYYFFISFKIGMIFCAFFDTQIANMVRKYVFGYNSPLYKV